MNIKPCILIIILLLFCPIVSAQTAINENIDDIALEGGKTLIIEGGSHTLKGGLKLTGNTSLTLKNTIITFSDTENPSYTLSGNSTLTANNTTIIWLNTGSLQASEDAAIILTNSKLISEYEIDNVTKFTTGIGLRDNSRLKANESQLGFIRLAGKAQCSLNTSSLENFGTQSTTEATLTDCTVENLILYYENNLVQVNQTLIGNHISFKPSQLVKTGTVNNDFTMHNCTIKDPPRLVIVDGVLEAKNTFLDIVYMDGDSAIETNNTTIDTLLMQNYCWATTTNTNINTMYAMRGDFNIQQKNTTTGKLHIYETSGLNLRTQDTRIDTLKLDWCIPGTPQNIELIKTEINDLQINMLSPQPIQCSDVTIGNLTTEAGWGDEVPITITGSINFTEDAKLNQATREGYTSIKRVYYIDAIIDDHPAMNTPLTIHLENTTKTITTDQNGKAVLPITYTQYFSLIQNPEPGGPYLINRDNLTRRVTITLNNQNHTINLLTDTPLRLNTRSNTTSEPWRPDWSQYTTSAIILTAIAITLYMINTQRREKPNNTTNDI